MKCPPLLLLLILLAIDTALSVKFPPIFPVAIMFLLLPVLLQEQWTVYHHQTAFRHLATPFLVCVLLLSCRRRRQQQRQARAPCRSITRNHHQEAFMVVLVAVVLVLVVLVVVVVGSIAPRQCSLDTVQPSPPRPQLRPLVREEVRCQTVRSWQRCHGHSEGC